LQSYFEIFRKRFFDRESYIGRVSISSQFYFQICLVLRPANSFSLYFFLFIPFNDQKKRRRRKRRKVSWGVIGRVSGVQDVRQVLTDSNYFIWFWGLETGVVKWIGSL
jgi:hypothetical protein